MKNLGDKIVIGAGHRAEDGTKLEPEEQPAQRVIETEAEVAHGQRAVNSSMRTRIVADMQAGEAARMLSQPCRLCAHWRPDEWPRVRRAMEATPEGRAELNAVRASLLSAGATTVAQLENGDDPSDAEHGLAAFGVCVALSGIAGVPQMSLPDACCPDGVGPAGERLDLLFTPKRGGEARRAEAATFDHLMRKAQGR